MVLQYYWLPRWVILRIPDSYNAKTNEKQTTLSHFAWSVKKLNVHLWSIGQKGFCWILKGWFITSQNVQRLQIFAIFA